MTQSRRRIDRILADGYLSGLGDRSVAEVRAMRADTSEEESLLSYERRLIHGRIAIIEAELLRRAGDGEGSLVDRLKDILSDGTVGGTRGGGNLTDPKFVFDKPNRPTTRIAMDDTLARLDDLSNEEIEERLVAIRAAEREVSEIRGRILPVLDELNADLARRYASGDADPADALS